MSRALITSSIVAALGALLFGFDTVVISGAEQRLEVIFAPCANLTVSWAKFWHGFLMASALLGTVVGSLAVGRPCDSYGRRSVMSWLAWIFLISAAGCALAWNWYSFVAFRFLGGLAIGGASVVTPMYIAEISPAKWRGRLVALTQLNTVLGILLAYLSNYIIVAMQLGDTEWRWMFAVGAVPAVGYYLLLFNAPRSPRWLMTKGREDEARLVLERVGIDSSKGNIDAELDSIRRSIDLDHHSLQEPFFQRKYSSPILLAFAIAAFNQLSGINAVLYYSRRIFESAGYSANAGLLNSVGLGLVILVFTVLAMAMIDALGRKQLMLIGSIGYIASLSVTAWAFYTQRNDDGSFTRIGSQSVLLGLLCFIASHAIGQGAVIWVFIGEIFPNRLRARGQAFGSFVHWTFAAVISLTFPLFAERSGGNAFAFYAVCMLGQLLWVVLKMPETKGIPLEDIQKRLRIE